MSALDWLVLLGTLLGIATYGVWKTRGVSAEGHLRGDPTVRWPTIGLAVMATQASAITFLSTPGQAYEDGLRFVQFYFGLPLAMVVLSSTFVPRFFRAKVFTAYELLESRFDLKTRLLAALLFLIQRGLSAGITIYAPAIILSRVLGWPLDLTTVAIGLVVIVYTVAGGSTAVAQTQKLQMLVMMGGMAVALVYVVLALPSEVSFGDAVSVAGALGKMNAIDLSFDPTSRYTLWSGLTGGFFLAMAYFGTDQSQVQRYITSRSIAESRMGMLFNGLFKVPMQFFILLTGVMVLVFHIYVQPPVFFNESELKRVRQTVQAPALEAAEAAHARAFEEKRTAAQAYVAARDNTDETALETARVRLVAADQKMQAARADAKAVIKAAHPDAETKDADYIFISFVIRYLPTGLVGLLLAVIFSGAMSSVSGELTALGSTATVDFYKRVLRPDATDAHFLRMSKVFTIVFGLLAMSFAAFASLIDNLIQAVNLLGSLFYGTVLGIFLVAFYVKRVKGTAVFIAALLAESLVIGAFLLSDLGFLWFNVIGAAGVVVFGLLLQQMLPRTTDAAAAPG
ncbi:MAG: sodium:solute symporter [Myxococcota bacterium]|nr:sodium:solute symporter [Myxococcota bacterium]